MQHELRFASFNLCNLALPGVKCYEDAPAYSAEEYEAKVSWIAEQLDRLDADVIGLQEVFSLQAAHDVLAKTANYRGAALAGFEPESAEPPAPKVALISRIPLAVEPVQYTHFPHDMRVGLPFSSSTVNQFSRAVLHAQVVASNETNIHVFVCHLKSKRPDFGSDAPSVDPDLADIGALRSLFRRGAEALAIRRLLTECMRTHGAPVVVLGDFNDNAGAVSTRLVMGGSDHDKPAFATRLFDSYRIQSSRDPLRDVGYTHIHDGSFETVDHILVSGHFNPACSTAIGNVESVIYLNDHVAFGSPATTDHGLVMARLRMFGPDPAE